MSALGPEPVDLKHVCSILTHDHIYIYILYAAKMRVAPKAMVRQNP